MEKKNGIYSCRIIIFQYASIITSFVSLKIDFSNLIQKKYSITKRWICLSVRIKKSVFINLFNEIIKKIRSLCWKVWELRKKGFYTGCKKSSAYLRIIWHLIDYTVVTTMKWLKSLNVSLKCMYHFNKVKCWPLHCCFHSYINWPLIAYETYSNTSTVLFWSFLPCNVHSIIIVREKNYCWLILPQSLHNSTTTVKKVHANKCEWTV